MPESLLAAADERKASFPTPDHKAGEVYQFSPSDPSIHGKVDGKMRANAQSSDCRFSTNRL